jgi:hypothetical protein
MAEEEVKKKKSRERILEERGNFLVFEASPAYRFHEGSMKMKTLRWLEVEA